MSNNKLTKKRKKYIRDNFENLSLPALAKETGVNKGVIQKYISKELNSKHLSKKQRLKSATQQIVRENITSLRDLKEFIFENKAIFAILAIVCIAVYVNSLGGDFVSDDIRAYVENDVVQNLGASLKTYNFNTILYAVFYAAFGLNEVPLHIFSLGLHITATMLGFIFISMAFDKRIGILATMLFAVHPINTEAVDWISGRKYLMIASIIFITTILYIIYKNSKNVKYLIASAVFLGVNLAVMQFSWLIVTPLLVIIIDLFILEPKITFKNLFIHIPLLSVVGLFTLFFLIGKYAQRVQNLETQFNFDYQQTAPIYMRIPFTIFNTMKLFVYPKDLTLYHEGEVLKTWFFSFMVVMTILFVVSIFYFWKKNRKIAGLLLFILVAIAPTLSPTQVAWLVAERYLYTASLAFCVLLGMLFIHLEKKSNINNLTVYLLIIVMSIYSFRTVVRNNDWKTRRSLWESTQRVSPNSARVYNNLGDVYGKDGETDRAIQMFQQALRVDPTYAEAAHNLGNTYARAGDFDIAKNYFKAAYELKPTQFQSLHMLGVIELQSGNLDEAQSYFEQVVNIAPAYSPSQEGLKLTIEAKQNNLQQ